MSGSPILPLESESSSEEVIKSDGSNGVFFGPSKVNSKCQCRLLLSPLKTFMLSTVFPGSSFGWSLIRFAMPLPKMCWYQLQHTQENYDGSFAGTPVWNTRGIAIITYREASRGPPRSCPGKVQASRQATLLHSETSRCRHQIYAQSRRRSL